MSHRLNPARDLEEFYPDNRYRLTSRWKNLPHFEEAYNEAASIVYVLSRNPKYGWSRRTNGRGTRYKGPRRFMDRFVDSRHAMTAVTKVVLRDRYGEIPSTLALDEVRL